MKWLAPVLLGVCWLLVAAGPWLLLDHQQHLHRTDEREALWPLYTLLTGVFWGLLVGLLCWKDRGEGAVTSVRWERGRWVLAGAVGLAGLLFVQHEVRAFARTVWFSPISPVEGDMLPLIQSALRDFWRDGVYPYRLHEVAAWELPLTFTPGLWLPYSLPWLAGVGIRFVGAAAAAAAGLACIGWAAWRIAEAGSAREVVAAVPVLFLPAAMLSLEYFDDFLSASHLVVYWAVAVFAAMAVRLRLHATSGLLLGWLVIARVYMVLLFPFVGLYAWRLWREDRRAAVRLLVCFAAPGVLLAVPFFLWDPAWYTRGFLAGYGEQLSWHIEQTPYFVHGLGWTGLLGKLDAAGAGTGLGLVLQVPLWVHAWRRLRTERDLLLYGAAGLVVFLSFSMVPWFYIYGALLVFLAFAPPAVVAGGAPPVLSRRAAHLVVAGTAAAAVLLMAVVMLWARGRDVRYGEFPADADSALYFEARRTLWGFDYHAWVSNSEDDWRLVTGQDAFVAMPVRDVAAGRVVIALRGTEPAAQAHVHINNEYAGTHQLPEGEGGVVSLPVPEGNLFRGGNLLRVRLEGPAGEVVTGWELGAVRLDSSVE